MSVLLLLLQACEAKLTLRNREPDVDSVSRYIDGFYGRIANRDSFNLRKTFGMDISPDQGMQILKSVRKEIGYPQSAQTDSVLTRLTTSGEDSSLYFAVKLEIQYTNGASVEYVEGRTYDDTIMVIGYSVDILK